jgi:hypothetical protein
MVWFNAPSDAKEIAAFDLSAQGKEVQAIKSGFDFDSHPIICLVTKAALSPNLNEGATTDFIESLDIEGHLNKTIGTQTKKLRRTAVQQVVLLDPQRPGVWRFKGDRFWGLNVVLKGVASGLGGD